MLKAHLKPHPHPLIRLNFVLEKPPCLMLGASHGMQYPALDHLLLSI